MKQYFKSVATQFTAIALAALGAAAIAFIQSIAVQTGACTTDTITVTEVGVLGGMFKGIHTAITNISLKPFV